MYSAFECSRVAAGPDGSADRSQTDSRVLSSHDPKTGFPIDGLDRFASMSSDRSQTDSRVLSSHDPKTGFPIDGLDRFASMSSSPPQFVNAATSPLLFLAEPL